MNIEQKDLEKTTFTVVLFLVMRIGNKVNSTREQDGVWRREVFYIHLGAFFPFSYRFSKYPMKNVRWNSENRAPKR